MSPLIYKKSVQKRKFYNFTLMLIVLNFLIFLVMLVLQYSYGNIVLENVAIQPSLILQGKKLWTVVTSMFMHANFMHLFVNMMSLLFLGSFLERLIGSKRFIFIYLVAGIVASLAFAFLAMAFNSDLNVPAVGASGAIFGIGGVLAVLTPKLPIYILFIPIAMPMWLGIILMLALMWVVSAVAGLPIGNTAHLGGVIAGLIYGFYLRFKYKKKAALLDRYFR
ncbi:MAG: rhomboid family intramembrane serine protease [Candidatus Pacearchaeota archaeon]|nr:rhomboid family intramembrane serine protease [Candidatus Pacearchaeota archaeon]